MKTKHKPSHRAIFIALAATLLFLTLLSPSLSLVKTKIDLGNIITGDELYLDAETIFNHDFKENPNYFVYPISNKGALEMLSVAKNEFVTYPQNCENSIAATKRGVLVSCDTKIVYYSYKEKGIVNEIRLPENTNCGGSYMGKEKRFLYFVCRKNVENR